LPNPSHLRIFAMRLAMDRLYTSSNCAEHPQHPIQLLLFASSLGIDRMPQSA